MSKLCLLIAASMTVITVGSASAFQLKGTPYNFTGTVVSATASCPYKANQKLAGYSLLQTRYSYSPPLYQQTLAGFSGPALIFSPGGTAEKTIIKIGNLPLKSGSVSGNAQVIVLPTLGTIKGTYKGAIGIKSNVISTLNLTSTFKNNGVNCTTTYDLTFTTGVPAKFLNLL